LEFIKMIFNQENTFGQEPIDDLDGVS